MDSIVVISQNVILDSLHNISDIIPSEGNVLVVSTQYLFDNEREIVDRVFGKPCSYICFSEIVSDSEEEKCDVDAYDPRNQRNVLDYYQSVKIKKNKLAISKLLKSFPYENKFIVCDDLGLHLPSWKDAGFEYILCEYYYNKDFFSCDNKKNLFISLLKKAKNIVMSPYRKINKEVKKYFSQKIYVAYHKGKKYLFFGSLNRISYRLNLEFKVASKWENIRLWLDNKGINTQSKTVRLSTLHESCCNVLPDKASLNLKIMQDGYLPPNYCSKYLCFFGQNVEFYTWDAEGQKIFQYHNLTNRVIPFRKKLYLPEPVFPKRIKKVLCVASGAGDWTAVKNRSDEDKMIITFGKIAAMFPNIEFVYRCHPVWIHPQHQGVNSINRAAEYISWLGLPNLKISSNIPCANNEGHFQLSFKRSSFEEDLKDVDIVFGEHSISMIDAAFKNILFGSVNVTGHRDFFKGITEMGFPHCESIEEIAALLNRITSHEFKQEYLKAVSNYNNMTDKD